MWTHFWHAQAPITIILSSLASLASLAYSAEAVRIPSLYDTFLRTAPPSQSPPSSSSSSDRSGYMGVTGKRKQSHAAQAKRQDRTPSSRWGHSSRSGSNLNSSSGSSEEERRSRTESKRDVNVIPDTWFIQRAFQGQSFFDAWDFATYPDPTRGQVLYVSHEWASQTNMTYINEQGQAIMRVDNWSTLAPGAARNSVRIESHDVFNKGLFILDVAAAPWGCGVWPAWWTVGANWPWQGEIDVLEYVSFLPPHRFAGVHDNVHNQVTFHTGDNCSLATPSSTTPASQSYIGEIAGTNCYVYGTGNSGCAVIDPSVASYGTQFNTLGGGVFAMMWLDEGIRVWFFHRAAIPDDITNSAPKPSTWGTPTTFLGSQCDIDSHFKDHQIVFDITFCGDWAGASYIDSGCPGTCSDRIQQPGNFENASWTINYVHVFGSPDIAGGSGTGAAARRISLGTLNGMFGAGAMMLLALFITLGRA